MEQVPTTSRYDFTIHTYGCKVNTYDTGLLQKRFEKVGHRSVAADVRADASLQEFGLGRRTPRIHVLNTCAVTGEATREAAKAVRRIKAKDPFSTVVVTGCGAQVDGAVFDTLPGADLVVANSHKGFLEELLDRHFKGELTEKVFRSNIFRKDDVESGGGIESAHTRAFLKIQDGCNSFCTYCVIPFARGKSRSISVPELVRRVRELHSSGAQEVVLTGVHIGDYEDTFQGAKVVLHDLVREVLNSTSIPRLRLSSLEPVELTPELIALYSDERMCRHFHMSIQSANTRVLHAMRRQYDATAVEEALLMIQEKVPGSFVGMDVIAGFSGETEEEFLDTYERLQRLPWTRIHVFPYSERPGTKAASFPDSVSKNTRALRAQRLRDLSSDRLRKAALAQIGQTKRLLMLKNGREGLTRDYWPVRFDLEDDGSNEEAMTALAGREVDVKILDFDQSLESRMDGVLRGQVVL